MILVAVDSRSKWIEAIARKHATTETTVLTLRHMFSRFGTSRTVDADYGTQLTSAECAQFFENNDVQHLRTVSYHPQLNGLPERAVRTIKEGLNKLKQGTLSTRLAQLLFSYRRTPLPGGASLSQKLLRYQLSPRLDTCLIYTLLIFPYSCRNQRSPI